MEVEIIGLGEGGGKTFRSHLEATPGNIPEQQPVGRKHSVSCEVSRIGATGVAVLPPTRTTIFVGARKDQPAQSEIINGSDYAGLPSSLHWPWRYRSQ